MRRNDIGRQHAAVMSVRTMFPGSHKATCIDRRIFPPETCFGFLLMDTVIDIVVKKVCTARSAQASCRSFLRSHFGSSFLASNHSIAAELLLYRTAAEERHAIEAFFLPWQGCSRQWNTAHVEAVGATDGGEVTR